MRSLAEVLQAELEVLQELVIACREEQAALVADDLAAIQAATARKGDLVRRLGELEQERRQVMMQTMGNKDFLHEAPNQATSTTFQIQQGQVKGDLTDWKDDLPARQEKAFPAGTATTGQLTPGNLLEMQACNSPADSDEALRAALRQAVQELQEVNETNRFLARQSLAYVQKILSLLVPDGAPAGIMDRVV